MLLHPMSGYQATADRQINHMLYMDDLKLFAKSDQCTAEYLTLYCTYVLCDVCLSFGLDKCARFTVSRGEVVSSNDIPLPDGISIRTVGVVTFKSN